MECLLILVVAATVLTGPQGKLTHAARTSPAEAFWRAALPGAPMPEAIRELLRPGAAGTNALDDARPRHHDADPPPLTFNYGDYKSTPRNEVAAPSAEVLDSVAGARNAAASSTVFFPGAPMPEAIRELLRPGAAGTDARPKYHDAEPPPLSFSYDVRPKHHDHDPPPLPPMNFNYDDYKSTPRNEAATPSAEVLDRVAGARNAAASLPTVFFLEEAVRVGGILPFPSIIPRSTANAAAAASPPLRLYTVRAVRAVEGCRFVVCRREAGPSSPGLGGDERDAVYGCLATGPSRAYVVGMVGERGETAAAAVVCRTDVSRWNRARAAAFWLLDVKPGGAAAVCHAALDAQVIPVKNNDRSSSLA